MTSFIFSPDVTVIEIETGTATANETVITIATDAGETDVTTTAAAVRSDAATDANGRVGGATKTTSKTSPPVNLPKALKTQSRIRPLRTRKASDFRQPLPTSNSKQSLTSTLIRRRRTSTSKTAAQRRWRQKPNGPTKMLRAQSKKIGTKSKTSG